jgi:ABC-type polysaccharide/polyol phosphate export permease
VHLKDYGMLSATKNLVTYGASTSKYVLAFRDIKNGVMSSNIWLSYGWMDILQRYRRAVIGPFWITLSMLIMVSAMGILYAGIFRINPYVYLPYLACGMVCWTFVQSCIAESTSVFVSSEGLIKYGGIPYTTHAMRLLYRNYIVFAHNILVIILIYIWQPSMLNMNIFYLIPSTLLVTATLFMICLIFGTICVRFRDFAQIITSSLQILFFISPIMYKIDAVPPKLMFVAQFNPVYYVVEAFRAPLLGEPVGMNIYLGLIFILICSSIAAFFIFTRVRHRIVFWL